MAKQPPDYPALGKQVGQLVARKQRAYGDSFGRSAEIFRSLYPTGIRPDQYGDALAIVRIVDKLFRLATEPEALGESPGLDIAGYGLLIAARHGGAAPADRPTFAEKPTGGEPHDAGGEPHDVEDTSSDQTIYPPSLAGRRFA